jgi:hypothetical protein
MEGGGVEQPGYKADLVSPEEVMASDTAEAIAALDAEIDRVDQEMAGVMRGSDTTDAPVDGARVQQLAERLRGLKIQRAELNPVEPTDEDL